MNSYQTLQLADVDGIRVITVSREKVLNALNGVVLSELNAAVASAAADARVRALIITGAGEKAFVAGADIAEFEKVSGASAAVDLARKGQEIFQAIEDCNKPVAAAINGFALGGGFELALACHFRLMSSGAKLGLPEVKLGLLPGYGGTQRLTKTVGRAKALELILTAAMVDAHEAHRLGLVNAVVDGEPVLESTISFLKRILAFSDESISGVLAATSGAFASDSSGYSTEANFFGKCLESDNGREGVRAFIEKRSPAFKN